MGRDLCALSSPGLCIDGKGDRAGRYGIDHGVLERPSDGQTQGRDADAFGEGMQLLDRFEVSFAEVDVRVTGDDVETCPFG